MTLYAYTRERKKNGQTFNFETKGGQLQYIFWTSKDCLQENDNLASLYTLIMRTINLAVLLVLVYISMPFFIKSWSDRQLIVNFNFQLLPAFSASCSILSPSCPIVQLLCVRPSVRTSSVMK